MEDGPHCNSRERLDARQTGPKLIGWSVDWSPFAIILGNATHTCPLCAPLWPLCCLPTVGRRRRPNENHLNGNSMSTKCKLHNCSASFSSDWARNLHILGACPMNGSVRNPDYFHYSKSWTTTTSFGWTSITGCPGNWFSHWSSNSISCRLTARTSKYSTALT